MVYISNSLSTSMKKESGVKIKILTITILAMLVLNIGSLFIYWLFRQHRSELHPQLQYENSMIIKDGRHNFLTDQIYWNGSYWFIYMNSKVHIGSTESKLVLMKSTDMQSWTYVKNFSGNGWDIRDPKFGIVHGKLFIYCLLNQGSIAAPRKTSYFFTEDGLNFSEVKDIDSAEGWLFWHPRTYDNITWYVSAYWWEHGKTAIFNSTDGIIWNKIVEISAGKGNDESSIIFMPDGRMLLTIREEVIPDNGIGHYNAGTILGVSKYPFTEWNLTLIKDTRFDGPHMFIVNNRIFCVARYQPEMDVLLTQNGGILSSKRTSIYELTENRIIRITDLPSGGDTSYGSVSIYNGDLYIAYYTSPVSNDYPWFIAMFQETEIRMVKISIANLIQMAENPIGFTAKPPIGGYIIIAIVSGLIIWRTLVFSKKNLKRPQ
jgi:hypothetical protein